MKTMSDPLMDQLPLSASFILVVVVLFVFVVVANMTTWAKNHKIPSPGFYGLPILRRNNHRTNHQFPHLRQNTYHICTTKIGDVFNTKPEYDKCLDITAGKSERKGKAEKSGKGDFGCAKPNSLLVKEVL